MVTLCVAQQDYWSATVSAPPSDASQDYVLLGASEYGGYTSVQFERNATTGDTARDVQFMVRFRTKIIISRKKYGGISKFLLLFVA